MIIINMHHFCQGRVLSRNICLGGKLRRGHSPRRQTSGGSGGSPPDNFEFQVARDAIQRNIRFIFLKNMRCTN